MFSIAIKNLRANLSRFVATMIAIATGVGFLTAGTMVTNSIQNSLGAEVDRQFAAVSSAVQLAGSDSDMQFVQASIPPEVLTTVQDVDGVSAAIGEVTGTASILVDGERLGADDLFAMGTTVRAWTDVESLSQVQLSDGRAPTVEGEITIDRGLAEENDIEVGGTVTLSTASGEPEEVTVVGITRFGTTDSPDQNGTITAVEPWVFELGGLAQPEYSRILVDGADDVSDSELTRRINAAIDSDYTAVSGSQFREDEKGESEAVLSVIRPALQGFSVLALLVCLFVIYNTFSVVVGQRIRELALMRAVAATPRQIRRALRVEGLGIGLIGSILGLGLGALITFGLVQILEAFDLDLPSAQISLTPGIVITGLVVGTLITFVSVLIPAFRAGRTAPIEAMREAALEPSKIGKVRLGFAIALFALGLLLMLPKNGWLLGPGAFFLVLGVFLAGPVLVVGIAKVSRPVLAKIGVAGRLSSDNIARNPKRTSTTMNALVIGLLLVTLVTVAGNSLKETTVDLVNDYSSADFIVSAMTGPIAPGLLDDIEQIDGVENTARLSSLTVEYGGRPDALTAVDGADVEAMGIKVSSGSLDDLAGGVAVFDDGTASLGQQRTYTSLTGEKITLETTAIPDFSFEQFSLGSIVSAETLEQVSPGLGETGALLKVDGDRLDAVEDDLRAVTSTYSNVVVAPGNFFGQIIESVFDFLINAVNGLLGMSIVIAMIGIVNTLTLSIFERRRELGLLRAVGMTSREVKRMIRLEAVQISVLGTVVGMSAGTLLAWLLLRASDFTKLEIEWSRLGILFALGVAIGIIAAVFPTRRVTKIDILAAVAAN